MLNAKGMVGQIKIMENPAVKKKLREKSLGKGKEGKRKGIN